MSSKSKIDHIAILVDDLKLAEEWYMMRMNVTVAQRDEKYIRLQADNLNISLLDGKHYSRNHIGVIVEDVVNLPLERGPRIVHRDGTVGVYEKDPFGNYLEYIWHPDKQKKVFLDD
tara:strand:+ start:490 stop:837 length:348 start_codon:yes stop_codon:yes gene_type:complete